MKELFLTALEGPRHPIPGEFLSMAAGPVTAHYTIPAPLSSKATRAFSLGGFLLQVLWFKSLLSISGSFQTN